MGRPFGRYSIATLVVVIVFGVLTGLDALRIAANLSTPWVGLWELALMLLQRRSLPVAASRSLLSS